MSKLALYRKYRPQSFNEIVGQDEVVESLKGAIEKKQISHAYLFVGTRGVGKTSTARIFAKELGVKEKDLYELDAASNRGIDDFREISESVHSLPFESPYKIYIIDEVHMLTKEAFNAFLKTLEEPPSHVIFILATTNPEKVPETIKSRCQIQEFKKANHKSISTVLQNAAKAEGFELGSNALSLIAFISEGSFRDAFGILQKAMSVSKDGNITLEDIEKVSFVPPLSKAIDFINAMSDINSETAFSILSELESRSVDFKHFGKLLLNLIREILFLRFAELKIKDSIKEKYTEETFENLLKISKNAPQINSTVLKKLIEHMELMSYTDKDSLALEVFTAEYFENNK